MGSNAKNNPTYYAVLPADVRYDPELTLLEKILYAEITALTNSMGYCWAGNKYFARLYGRSAQHISLVINRLVMKGFLIVDSQKGGSQGGSERVISLPKKHMFPPAPTYDKHEAAQINPIPTYDKHEAAILCDNRRKNEEKGSFLANEPLFPTSCLSDVGTLYDNILNNKKNCSFLKNEPLLHFCQLWENHPLKSGKKEAFKHFKASVKNKLDWQDIRKALENYLLHLKSNPWKQPQAGKTWFNNWHDWIDWEEPETTEDAQARHKKLDGLILRAADISNVAFAEIADDEFEHVKAELIKQSDNAKRDYKILCEEIKSIRHDDYKAEIIGKILRKNDSGQAGMTKEG